ncbi:MAG: tetratricopeptide repeat protein [Candidatus Eisenbacteria bacterium]
MNATHHPNRHRAGAGVALLMLAGTLFTSVCALFRSGGDGELTARDEPTALQQAIDWATQQASAIVPDEPAGPHHLAELYVRSGRGDDAEHALHDALARDPRAPLTLSPATSGRPFQKGLELLSSVPIDSFPRGERVCSRPISLTIREALGDPRLTSNAGTLPRRHRLERVTRIDCRPIWSCAAAATSWTPRSRPGMRWISPQEDAVPISTTMVSPVCSGDPETTPRVGVRIRWIRTCPVRSTSLAIVERFYFFDDKAAQGYFDQYASLSSEDPDGLRLVFQTDAQSRVVRDEEAER